MLVTHPSFLSTDNDFDKVRDLKSEENAYLLTRTKNSRCVFILTVIT